MATPFETAITSATTAVEGYAATGLPYVAGVTIAFLGLKFVKRILNKA